MGKGLGTWVGDENGEKWMDSGEISETEMAVPTQDPLGCLGFQTVVGPGRQPGYSASQSGAGRGLACSFPWITVHTCTVPGVPRDRQGTGRQACRGDRSCQWTEGGSQAEVSKRKMVVSVACYPEVKGQDRKRPRI